MTRPPPIAVAPRPFLLLSLTALPLTGCQQACELAALGVAYLHGFFFGSMGVLVIALILAVALRRTRRFWPLLFMTFGLGAAGLTVGFLVTRAIPCEDLWLHRGVPWLGALLAMPWSLKLAPRR